MARQIGDKKDPMTVALAYARRGAGRGEVPVGAVIVDGKTGEILTRRHNLVEAQCDPTAHAELLALRAVGRRLGTARLAHCDLYVTLEPCPMCAQAISFARIRRLYFGASDPKGGGVDQGPRIFSQSTCHHRPEVIGGLRATECGALLKDFFKARR
jgi:tRNA(Arg) A34 adenosine deaminase TadA